MTEDIKPEVIKKTQAALSKFIKKPALSEKLLKKPPFRFLHDIITNVIRETGFLSGLYDETEMQSENVKAKEMKIAFLQKLIDVVKIVTNANISARPNKIIAGLEPTRTNQLLQVIAQALENNLDSSEAISLVLKNDQSGKQKTNLKEQKVKKLRESIGEKHKDKMLENKLIRKPSEDKILVQKLKSSPGRETEIKKNNSQSIKEKFKVSTPKDERKDLVNPKEKDEVEELKQIKKTDISKDTENLSLGPVEEKTSEESVIQEPLITATDSQQLKCLAQESLQISITQQQKPELMVSKEPHKKEGIIRTASNSLRPPSVRPSSARPGAPRLRDRTDIILPPDELVTLGKFNVIVENFSNKNEQDDEETVIIDTTPENLEWPQGATVSNIPTERGHLVSQILEQIEETQNVPRVQITWDQEDTTCEATSVKLRQSLQTLTKAANPLGKLMNFLQEDVDTMRSELRSWFEVNEKLTSEIKIQKRLNEEFMQPLQEQLSHIDQEIMKQHEMIATTQASIIRNQNKIQALLM